MADLEIVVSESADEPAEPGWSAMETDMAAPSSADSEAADFRERAVPRPAPAPDDALDDPIADVAPEKRFVPDDDGPFA